MGDGSLESTPNLNYGTELLLTELLLTINIIIVFKLVREFFFTEYLRCRVFKLYSKEEYTNRVLVCVKIIII